MNDTCNLPSRRSDADGSASAEPPPWGFWASLGWVLLGWATAFFAAVVCVIAWMLLTHRHRLPDVSDPALGEVATSIVLIAGIAPLVIAVRRRRQSLRDYFALNGVPRRDLLLGVAALFVLEVVSEVAQRLFGFDTGSAVFVAEYGEAKLAGVLPVEWFGVVIVAPITEELTFRGFLHRGWAASRLGVTGTVLLTSALWAAMHQQYTAYGMFDVFMSGLVFGWIRQRSASTTPAIILHVLLNLVAMAAVTILVEWSS